MWLVLGIFAASAAVDFAWTKYMLAAAAKKPHTAALWSVAIALFGAFSVVSYVGNHWLLIPAAAGYYFGTWAAVTRDAK